MKNFVITGIACLLLLSPASKNHYLIVGTYTGGKSEGIYVYKFNSTDASFTEVSHVKTPNPSFVAVSPNEKYVYAVHENADKGHGGAISAFAFDKKTGALTYLNEEPTNGDDPCYVSVDKTGRWVIAGNYSSGSLAVLPVTSDGKVGAPSTTIKDEGSGPNKDRQSSPHVHCTMLSPDNKHLFVPDLGIDKVMMYDFDAASGRLTSSRQAFAKSPGASGPRHFTFHPNNRFAYLIEELSGTVEVFDYNNGSLKNVQRVSTMPRGDTSFAGSADIHVSPDGRFLYASNRSTSNTIAIFKINVADGRLRLVAHQSTLGETPRNFNFDPSGNFLLVANQNSGQVVIFKRNLQTGLLTDTGKRIPVDKPVCLKWISSE